MQTLADEHVRVVASKNTFRMFNWGPCNKGWIGLDLRSMPKGQDRQFILPLSISWHPSPSSSSILVLLLPAFFISFTVSPFLVNYSVCFSQRAVVYFIFSIFSSWCWFRFPCLQFSSSMIYLPNFTTMFSLLLILSFFAGKGIFVRDSLCLTPTPFTFSQIKWKSMLLQSKIFFLSWSLTPLPFLRFT